MAKSYWEQFETIEETPTPKKNPTKHKNYWEQFETIEEANTPASTPAPAPTGNVDLSNLDNIYNQGTTQPSLLDSAIDYAKKNVKPVVKNISNEINGLANNLSNGYNDVVNNIGDNLYNGISQIGNITYNPQQNLITGGGVSVTQPAPELKVNNNILNQVGGLLTNPKPQQRKFSLPQTTPNIPQYQPKQTGVLNPAVNAVGDVVSEIGDSTFRTIARFADNVKANKLTEEYKTRSGDSVFLNNYANPVTFLRALRDTIDPNQSAYADQNPAYFENKYFGSKENRNMLKALERGEIKPYTDEDFNYLQTNAVKNIDLKKNELQKLLDSGQISAQKADELYKGYINEVREQTKAQRVGMLEHNFRLQNEAEANFARVEQNSELANKAFAAYILAQTAGTVAPLELGGQKIGQAVTQAATKAAKEKLYKKLFYEEGLKAGLDKAVIDNAYKQVGKDFFLKNYAEKGFEEFGLTGAKKTAAEMGQNLLKGTIGAGTDMGVIGAASNAAANNTTLVDTGINPVEAFIEGAKEGAPYGAMSLIPYAGQGMAKALQNIKIKGRMKPYQAGTAVDIYKENPYVKYGYENGKGFYTYEDRTNGRTNKNFTEEDTYKRGGKKWEQIPQDIENLAPQTAAKQGKAVTEQVTKPTVKENLTTDNNTFTSYPQAFKEMKKRGKGFTVVNNNDGTYTVALSGNVTKNVQNDVKENAQNQSAQTGKMVETQATQDQNQIADTSKKVEELKQPEDKTNAAAYNYIHDTNTGEEVKLDTNKELDGRKEEIVKPIEINKISLKNKSGGKNVISGEIKRKLFKYGSDKKPIPIKATNKNTGVTAIINGRTINESTKELFNEVDKDLINSLLLNSKDIFENSELILSYKDVKNPELKDKQTISRYATVVKYDGEDYIAVSTLRNNSETPDIRVYHLAGYKNGSISSRQPTVSSLNATTTTSIADLADFVKSKVVEKYNIDYQNAIKNAKSEPEEQTQATEPKQEVKEQPKSKVGQLAPNIAAKQSEKLSKEEAINKTNKTLEENSKNSKLPKYTYTKDVSFNTIVTDGKFVSNGDFAMLADEIRMVKNPKTQVGYVEIEKLIPTVETKPFAEGVEFYTNDKKKPTQFVALETQDGDKRYINKKYYDLVKNGATLEYIEGKPNSPLVVKKDGKTIGVIMPVQMRDTSDLTKIESQAPAKTETKAETKVSKKVAKIAPKTAEKQKTAKESKSQKYEDYGEKIEGARKDIWQTYNKIFDRALPETYEEFTKTKLSDVFPDIDGNKFIEAGGDEDTAAVIKLLRDSIPTKPSGVRAIYRYRDWTKKTQEYRDYAQKILNGEMTADEAVDKLVYRDNLIDYEMKRKAAAYRAVGYPACKNIKGYMLNKGEVWDKDGGKQEKWTITRENSYGLEVFDTKEEAVNRLKEIAGIKKNPVKKEAKLEIGKWNDERRANGYIIYYKAGTGKYIELKNKFETAKEAREYLIEHKQELLEQLSKMKEEPPMRGEVNEPRVGKGFRKGKDITPEEFSKTFGFRGVQFGNYVEGTKRIEDINNAYDSLMDMAEVLHLPEEAISLNGELGLAFGARGTGGKHAASAHYEPLNVVINLTKKKGAGSLAHEWWHALDNYFGKKNKGEMATETYGVKDSAFREEMAEAYTDVKKAVREAIYERSKELDKARTKDYWSTDVEMTARAFETYIKHKINSQGFSNDYLANIIGEEYFKTNGRENAYPYPTKAEMPAIEKAFDNFFNTIKTRETDKGVELYNLINDNDIDLPDFIKNNQEANKSISNYWDFKDSNIIPVLEKTGMSDKFINFMEDKVKEISDLVGFNSNDLIQEFQDFKTLDINGSSKKNANAGLNYNGNLIAYNPDSIKTVRDFLKVTSHELGHFIQFKCIERIDSIPEDKWTPAQRQMVEHFKEMNNFYDEFDKFVEDNGLEDVLNTTRNLTTAEKQKYISNLDKETQKAYNKYQKEFMPKYNGLWFENNAQKISNQIDEVLYGTKYDTKGISGRNSNDEFGKAGNNTPNITRGSPEKISGIGSQKQRKEIKFTPFSLENNSKSETDTQIENRVKDEVYKWHGEIGKNRYDVDKILNSFVNISKGIAKKLDKKITLGGVRDWVTDKDVREILPFLRERTEVPAQFKRLRSIYDKLSKEDIKELTALADNVSKKFEKYYTEYQEAKEVDNPELVENHISHIWDLDKKHKGLMTNYFTTKSGFAQQRTIKTLLDGINGIDINGEKVYFKPKTLDYAEILKSSSDSLIKATADSKFANIAKNLESNKQKLVLPASKAPADWVEINHPALNKAVYMGAVGENELPMLMKTPVKVHPAAAKYLNAAFEVQKPDNAAWKAYDVANGLIKQATLGFSGFHGWALSESGVGNVGLKKTLKTVLNFKDFWDAVMNNEYKIYKKEEIVKQAIEDGLQLGTPQLDTNRNIVENAISSIPVAGDILSWGVKANNKILWDVIHNNLKIMAYEDAIENLGENPTKEQRRAVAQWVNDSFGGQAWELLGVRKSSVKFTSRLLLSPDWNFSAIRQTFGAFNNKTLDNFLSKQDSKFWKDIRNVLEDMGVSESPETENVRGKRARAFWLRYLLYAYIGSNLMNAAFRERDRKEHPEDYPEKMSPFDYSVWANTMPNENMYEKIMPMIFIGRNKDGKARYLRLFKQAREVPEFATKPIEKISGKSSALINVLAQTALGLSPADIPKMVMGNKKDVYFNQNIWNGFGEYAEKKKGGDLAIGMARAAGKSVMPFIAQTAMDDKHEFSAWDFVAQTSKGGGFRKTEKQMEESFEKGRIGDIKTIAARAKRDGLAGSDVNNAIAKAEKEFKSKYAKQIEYAIEYNRTQNVDSIKQKLKRKGYKDEYVDNIYKQAKDKFEKKFIDKYALAYEKESQVDMNKVTDFLLKHNHNGEYIKKLQSEGQKKYANRQTKNRRKRIKRSK